MSEKNNRVELYTEEIEFDDWEVPLNGKYQEYNAALASLTVVKTFNIDDPSIITRGIKNVIKNTHIQGRYEPKVILDSAHNPEGIRSFVQEFSNEKDNYDKRILLFGAMKDKNIEEMLNLLKDSFDEIHFTEISTERTATIQQLKEIANKIDLSFKIVNDIKVFLMEYFLGKRDDCLVITGSMYLLGDVKSVLAQIKS